MRDVAFDGRAADRWEAGGVLRAVLRGECGAIYFIDLKMPNLQQAVADRKFRDDLYYRLNVIEIRIPPLRERREDVPLLARHFMERLGHELGKDVADFSEGALKVLMDYNWPGNVRELENAWSGRW